MKNFAPPPPNKVKIINFLDNHFLDANLLISEGNKENFDNEFMHQSVSAANIPLGNPRGFAPTFTEFVPSELPGGCPGIGPFIYYHK